MKYTEKKLLGEEIKSILCDMAVNDTLPLDLTQLDMDSVIETASKNLNNNEFSKVAIRVEKLDDYLSSDKDNTLADQYQILDKLGSKFDDEMVDYIDGIQVLQLYEFSLTVAELWGLITEGE